jgi:hypothetical protein
MQSKRYGFREYVVVEILWSWKCGFDMLSIACSRSTSACLVSNRRAGPGNVLHCPINHLISSANLSSRRCNEAAWKYPQIWPWPRIDTTVLEVPGSCFARLNSVASAVRVVGIASSGMKLDA